MLFYSRPNLAVLMKAKVLLTSARLLSASSLQDWGPMGAVCRINKSYQWKKILGRIYEMRMKPDHFAMAIFFTNHSDVMLKLG